MNVLRNLALGALAILLPALPLLAHHDWPVDQTKEITVKGNRDGVSLGRSTRDDHAERRRERHGGKVERRRLGPEILGGRRLGQGYVQAGGRHHRHRLSLPGWVQHAADADDRDGEREGDVLRFATVPHAAAGAAAD